jgi:hypothetical protein
MRGHRIEGRKSLDALLQTSNSGTPPAILAWALLGAGILGMNHYDHSYVAYRQILKQQLEEALRLFNTIGDDAGMALSLCYLGVVTDDLADVARDSARALSLLQEGLAFSRRQSTHAWITAHILNRLAITLWRANLAQATPLCKESLALARHLGDAQAIAVSLIRLTEITGAQLDFVQAAKLAEEALHLAREMGDISNVISVIPTGRPTAIHGRI